MTMLTCLLLTGLSGRVCAADWETALDIPHLRDTVPKEAEDILGQRDPLKPPDGTILRRIRDKLLTEWEKTFPEELKTGAFLVLIAVLVSLGCSFCTSLNGEKFVLLAGITVISAYVLSDFQTFLHTELSSLESLSDFSKALLPTLTAAAAAGGAVTGSAARYAATMLAMDGLMTVAQSILSPLICAMAALTAANAALEHPTLLSAGKLVKTVCSALLILIAFAFTLWISFTGILNGTVDAATTRAAKTAVSAALPVVGSVISDAAGSLAAAANTVRNSIGIFGLIAVLAVCIGPFLRLLLRYLAFKLAGAAAECVTDRRLSALINGLGDCFGFILALNGCGALMLFVSVFSMMRCTV